MSIRKLPLIIIVCIILVAIPCILFAIDTNPNDINQNDEPVLGEVHVSWIPLEGGENEVSVIKNSTVIARGRVIDSYTEIKGDAGNEMVFTNNVISIEELYAIDREEKIKIQSDLKTKDFTVVVQQTGGKYKDFYSPEIGDAPLLVDTEEYLLFLSKTDEGYYIPVGGRLGYAKFSNDKVTFINADAQALMKSFEGKQSSIVTDTINTIDSSIGKDFAINSEQKTPDEFFE
jgi:hypothetical protein